MQKTVQKTEVREKVELRRVTALNGVEVVRATYLRHHFPKHSHDVFAFGIIERGAQATEYRGATHVAVAGDICLVNPGEVHTGYPPEEAGWSYRCCYPDPDLVLDIAAQVSQRNIGLPYFPSPVIHDPVVFGLFYHLFLAIERAEDVLGVQEAFTAAISAIVSRHATESTFHKGLTGADEQIGRARDYIEAHWSEQLSLKDMAAAVGMESYRLIRAFRRKMGITPHAYVIQKRIEKGKKLLLSGRATADVALDTGFFDQSHFAKQFKRFTGITPASYTRSCEHRNGKGS